MMQHLQPTAKRLVASAIDASNMATEIERQLAIEQTGDAQTIALRDWQEKANGKQTLRLTEDAPRYPICYRMARRIAKMLSADLGRILLVHLPPATEFTLELPQALHQLGYEHYMLELPTNESKEGFSYRGDLVCVQDPTVRNTSGTRRIFLLVDAKKSDDVDLALGPEAAGKLLSTSPLRFLASVLHRRVRGSYAPEDRPSTPDWSALRPPQYHFDRIKSAVEVAPMLQELSDNEWLWSADSSRQRLHDQQHTETIFIRGPVRHENTVLRHEHESAETKYAEYLPAIHGFVKDFAREMDATLGRLSVVRLKPNQVVYPHIDTGEYYRIRDRYHLVLQSHGSKMISGGEGAVFQKAELWWFDNKAMHEAMNSSDEGRIHVIFDMLPNNLPARSLRSAFSKRAINAGSLTAAHRCDEQFLASIGSYTRSSLKQTGTSKAPNSLSTVLDWQDGFAFVGLRSNGQLVASAWGSGNSQMERLTNALSTSRDDLSNNALSRVDTAEICLCGDAKEWDYSDENQRTQLNANVHRGLRALELTAPSVSDARLLVSPTMFIASNRSVKGWVDRYLQEAGLEEKEASRGKLKVRTMAAEQYLVKLASKRPAIGLYRGTEVVQMQDVTSQSVRDLAELLGEYLINCVNSDGRATYQYLPSRGEEANKNNMIRQWMATLALGRYARFTHSQQTHKTVDRNIRYNLNHYYRKEHDLGVIDCAGKVKLGAVALAALAIHEHVGRADFTEQETALAAMVEHLWHDNGEFQTFYSASRNDNQNFYPGEALLYWSCLLAEERNEQMQQRFDKSFAYYRDWHRKNPNPAFVPWHTQAYYRMWRTTQREDYADFIFEMNDWLLPMQQWRKAPHPDMKGRFYDRDRPFGPPHASSTGVYLEGLADAYSLARQLNHTDRADRYRRTIVRGLRSVMQLTFRNDVDMFYVGKRTLVRGGVRTTEYDNRIRIDNVQHNLMAILKILDVFDRRDFQP